MAEALNLLSVEDAEPRQGMLFQLPSILPSPAKEIKTEPLDRRRKLGLDPPPEHQPALTFHTLPPGKVHPSDCPNLPGVIWTEGLAEPPYRSAWYNLA